MNIEEKKQQLNALMTEYSQLKGNPANNGRRLAIKNQTAVLIFDRSGVIFKYLYKVAKDKSEGYATRYAPDEFITETYLKYFEEYDYNRNDNFFKYFIYFLGCTISNMIRTEHIEHYPPMPSYTDDEGNEIDLGDITPGEGASPERIAEIHSLQDLMVKSLVVTESISENEAETRIRFIEYFSKLIPCVIQAREHRGNRDKYYRAFASDFYIASCKSSFHLRYNMNENEAFRNMDCDFVDYTLTDVCRTFEAFERTPCKTYKEIGVTESIYASGEIETPFRNWVYSVYFGVTEGAISQNRDRFHKDIGILVNKER